MASRSDAPHRAGARPVGRALAGVLVAGVAYTLLELTTLRPAGYAVLAFLPGLAGQALLARAGVPAARRYLRPAPLSRAGAAALVATTLLLLPILGSSSGWTGWRPLAALVGAPASGLAQELYFRASLLPALERVLPERRRLALLLHALLFVGYHVRTFLLLPSLAIGAVVATVLFLAGVGWGWQVQRDRTAVWAAAQHAGFLVLMSGFGWS